MDHVYKHAVSTIQPVAARRSKGDVNAKEDMPSQSTVVMRIEKRLLKRASDGV